MKQFRGTEIIARITVGVGMAFAIIAVVALLAGAMRMLSADPQEQLDGADLALTAFAGTIGSLLTIVTGLSLQMLRVIASRTTTP